MKRVLIIFAISLLVSSCTQVKKEKSNDSAENNSSETLVQEQNEEIVANSNFNPNSLPDNTKDVGNFPFYSVPDWLETGGNANERENDFDLFEFFTGEAFYPVEGRLSIVHFSEKQGDKWNEYKFMKTFSTHFESLGANKIWEGVKTNSNMVAQTIAEKKGVSYIYHSTTQALMDNQVIYGLKIKDCIIFIALTANNAGGLIAVIQSSEFVQTVDIINADQIQKDLSEKGKSVLHINFDVDKATLQAEGKQAISEIAKALEVDKSLKISINGYTDNTGSEAHNLKLSKSRAETVLLELVKLGIDKSRLTFDGFGAQNPMADDATESGKAKNRRVELIKM